jgi:CRISPR system Cascade subunit CasA
MRPTFNLLKEPWIPCIQGDGKPVELSLRQALAQAHELRELHGESPLVVAALYRLLLAVLHRVYGPAGREAWKELWQAGRWPAEPLEAYLSQWAGRFDLFDAERPFFQSADDRVQPKSVARLAQEVASGNNPTLFDHHTDAGGITLSAAAAARLLVASQTFGLAGLSGIRQVSHTDAICTRAIVFLVQGESLFETLMLNLGPYPPGWVPLTAGADRPAWEADDPFEPDRAWPLGYLDHLTWHNRRVLLFPEEANGAPVVREMTMGPGLRRDAAVKDPMVDYREIPKKGYRPLAFREGRALWRDSAALLQLGQEGHRPVETLGWLAELVGLGLLDSSRTHRYLALGMSTEPGKQKVHFYRSERMPVPARLLQDPGLVEYLQAALELAEQTARQLWGAVATMASLVLMAGSDLEGGRQPDKKDRAALLSRWAVERHYWSRLETPFRSMVVALTEDPEEALADWQRTLQAAAWEALNQVADQLEANPRHLKAAVRARGRLASGLRKLAGDSERESTSG